MSEKRMSPELQARVEKIAEGPEPKFEERMLHLYESLIPHDPELAQLFLDREALSERMNTAARVPKDVADLTRVERAIAIRYAKLTSVREARKAA